MKPIYEPSGRAKEYSQEIREEHYSNLALNIYRGCPHGCLYCYAPLTLKCDRAQFHDHCEPKPGVVEATRKQLEKGVLKVQDIIGKGADGKPIKQDRLIELTGKSVFLCFTCDLFPRGVSHEPTYQIIKLLKQYENSVQLLTKGVPDDVDRLCELLDENDRYGITIVHQEGPWLQYEPNAPPQCDRYRALAQIKTATKCKTFMSLEPVVSSTAVFAAIKEFSFVDQFRIGKLNYEWLLPPELRPKINWGEFGHQAERLCIEHGRGYLIKEDLRREMNAIGDIAPFPKIPQRKE